MKIDSSSYNFQVRLYILFADFNSITKPITVLQRVIVMEYMLGKVHWIQAASSNMFRSPVLNESRHIIEKRVKSGRFEGLQRDGHFPTLIMLEGKETTADVYMQLLNLELAFRLFSCKFCARFGDTLPHTPLSFHTITTPRYNNKN